MAQDVFEVGVAVVVVLVRGVVRGVVVGIAVAVAVAVAVVVGVVVGVGVGGEVVLRKRGAVNNVSAMLYHTIVRLAEEGRRVIRVELPSRLYNEYMLDDGMPQMMRTLRVAVVSSNRSEPEFFLRGAKVNAERMAELMKLGLIQRKKEVLTALGRDTCWFRAGYGGAAAREEARVLVARADEVEEIEALLRSDLVKRAREILEAAK